MEGFQVTEIGEKIYCILDAGNSSFYVVEGEEKAAVIDTGITAGTKILPVIRELTDKPLLLVITHAHPDHMYHMLCWRRNRITCSPEMRSEAAAVSGCRCRAERAWKSIMMVWLV